MRAGAARTEGGGGHDRQRRGAPRSRRYGPGQIQLAGALYDSPYGFHRSVHVTNTSLRRMSLSDGDRIPRAQLPGPLRLCVGSHQSATFAVHALDHDGSAARFLHDYDEADDLLLGIQRSLRGDHRRQILTAGRDLIVRYRVAQRDASDGPATAERSGPARAFATD